MAEFPGQAIGGVNQGGIQPAYFVDTTGAQFWGVQTKANNGTVYQYVVYRQAPGATIPTIAWQHVGGQGNLCLQPDGRLVAVVFRAPGENAPILARTVPEWVARGS